MGSIELMSTTVLPLAKPAATPSLPNSTDSTSGVSGSIRNTTSAARATSALVAQAFAACSASGTLLRVRTNISWPAANRCCAMGAPMMPRPMNPIFIANPFLESSIGPLAGGCAWPARILAITCCAPAAIRRASELTVTNWKPLAMRASAVSGLAVVDACHQAVRLGPRQDVVDGLRRPWVPGRRWSACSPATTTGRTGRCRPHRVLPPRGCRPGCPAPGAVSIMANRDDRVVGVLRVVGAAVQQGANRPEAARAARRVAGSRPPASAHPRVC